MFLRKVQKCIFYTSYIFTFCQNLSIPEPTWLNLVLNQVANEEKPYQITVFINKNIRSTTFQWKLIVKRIVTIFPTVIVDLSQNENFSANRSLMLPVHKNPRAANVIHMIILNQNGSQNCFQILNDTFNEFIHLAPIPPRAKVVVISLHCSCMSQNKLKTFFQNLWKKQFLDVLILESTENSDLPSKISYNPFTNELIAKILRAEDKLFPDKIQNMNKYPFKIPALDFPPYVEVINTSDTIDLKTLDYQYFKIFCETCNCTINLHKQLTIKETTDLENIFTRLINNELNMMPMYVAVSFALYFCPLVIGIPYANSNTVIILPNLIYPKLSTPRNALLVFFFLCFLMYSLALLSRYLRFTRGLWTKSKIFRILVGQPLKRSPSRLTERIVFLTLVLLSMHYTSQFLATLVDIKLLKEELHFNTLEELYETEIPIYRNDIKLERFYNDSEEIVKKVIMKAKVLQGFNECYEKNLKYDPSICITFRKSGEYAVKHYRGFEGKKIMKLSQFSIFDDNAAFVFETASPYVEKFDDIMKRIIESGIPKSLQHYDANKFQSNPETSFQVSGYNSSDHVFALQLLIILGTGYLFSAIVVSIEYILYKN